MSAPDLRVPLERGLAGHYTLGRELGRGGMATVFLAHDLKHDRPVALKVLHPELAASLGPDRFQREIRFAARLQHPHILPVHDSGETAGRLWFTMPFVEGESLRTRLSRERQLPLEDALRVAREAALALEYAHEHGVIHRDIKPENILLTTDGSTLVADFGVARGFSGEADRQGKWQEAIRSIKRATELDPLNYSNLVELAGTYDLVRDYARAAATADRAIGLAPDLPAAYGDKAMSYLNREDRLDSAVSTMHEALRHVDFGTLVAETPLPAVMALAADSSQMAALLEVGPAPFGADRIGYFVVKAGAYDRHGDQACQRWCQPPD